MPNILHVKRNFYQDDFSITKGIRISDQTIAFNAEISKLDQKISDQTVSVNKEISKLEQKISEHAISVNKEISNQTVSVNKEISKLEQKISDQSRLIEDLTKAIHESSRSKGFLSRFIL